MAGVNATTFRVRIYVGTRTDNEAEYDTTMPYCKRGEYRAIYLPGFDGRVTVRLDDLWLRLEKEERLSLTQEVIGYETIVKSGDTMQLNNRYTALLEVV